MSETEVIDMINEGANVAILYPCAHDDAAMTADVVRQAAISECSQCSHS